SYTSGDGWSFVSVMWATPRPPSDDRYIPFKPNFTRLVLEGFMTRFFVLLAMTFLMPATAAFAQNDLPQQQGQGGQQQPQVRPGFGGQGQGQGQGQGFGGQQGGANVNDPAFMQQVSYGLGRNFATNLKDNDIQVDLQSLMA